MNIVAIIPARINTKRVPNKMLRIIGKHPLVFYAIRNALSSQYISRVIVTTDSEDIAIVAKQMGAEIIIRESCMCGDNVSLDEVIHRTIENIDCDAFVCLLPTSPLLKSSTLDSAIEHFIKCGYDYELSVHKDERYIYSAEKRSLINEIEFEKNEYYIENGAFLISKKECNTVEKRKQTDSFGLFTISKEEAFSVCELPDVAFANMLLLKKSIAIYVNGNNTRGMGHIYRVLELADEFPVKPDIYFDISQTDREIFGSTYYNLVPVNGEKELISIIKGKHYELLINDILSTEDSYIEAIKAACPWIKIVNFEDNGSGAAKADLVINALYESSELRNTKYGWQYYIAPKKFLFYRPIDIKEKVEKVFVSFGGADPMEYSLQLMDMINQQGNTYDSYKFMVVVGRATSNIERIMEYNKFENIEVFFDVTNMPELISNCDIALTSRGRTGYELALMGIPTISIAQNAQEEKHNFISQENGFIYLGYNPSKRILKANLDALLQSSREERVKYQQKMLRNNLRDGRDRVLHLINSI